MMDEETLTWLLSDSEVDSVSGLPFSAIVFMLYYGMELQHFLLNISDLTLKKYPLKVYDVGRSSVYLCGSVAHGFYLNTKLWGDLKDFDIVSILNLDIRKECIYDKEETGRALYIPFSENERDRNFCPGESSLNTTCGSDKPYLNVEKWQDTYPGYVMLRKCRRHQPSVQSMSDRYVNSTEVMESRFNFWTDTKSYLRQPFDKNWGGDFSESGPLLSILNRHGPAVNVYLSDSYYAATSMINTDLVIALPYPGFPSIAEGEWFHRERPSGWPDEKLKLAVRQSRCEIVPTGHYLSPREDFEWKISFSHGEMLLSRSFSRVQREIVHILKVFISELPSYNILNLMYRQLERIHAREWTSQRIAHLVFLLLDVYIECVENKNLPHYFISQRNLLVKLLPSQFERRPGDFIPTKDYIDIVLAELYEFRRDPLTVLLNQRKNLPLSHELHLNVFKPFVENMKQNAFFSATECVNTLVRLTKAHIYEENIQQAYKYGQDALKLFWKIPKGDDEGKTELYLAVSVSSYLSGDIDSALDCLSALEPLLQLEKGVLGSRNIFTSQRSNYILLYARVLMIKHHDSNSPSVALEKIDELYSKLSPSIIVDIFTMLEKLQANMFLGKYEKVDSILEKLSFFLLPIFSQNTIFPLNIDSENSDSVDDKKGTIPLHLSLFQDVGNYKRSLSDEIQQADDSNAVGDGKRFKSTDVPLEEVQNDDNSKQWSKYKESMVENKDTTNIEQMDVVYKEDDSFNMVDSEKQHEPKKSISVLYDRQSRYEEDLKTYKDDALKTVDPYLIERCQIAHRYDKIGMHVKADEIMEQVRAKLLETHSASEVMLDILKEYASSKTGNKYDDIKTIPSYWSNVFHYSLHYVIFTQQEMPVLDKILQLVMSKSGQIIKLPHRVAFMHFLIERHKIKGEIEIAKEFLNQLDTMVENLNGECQLLVGYHYSAFGDPVRSVNAFKKVLPEDPVKTITEELTNRIDQLLDIASKYEIRNEGLSRIFD